MRVMHYKLFFRILLIYISLTAIYAPFPIHSQPVQQEWINIFNNNSGENDALDAMVLDTSGNVIITGNVYVPGQNSNFCTIKYNSNGIQQWIAFYNGPGSNSIDDAVAVTTDKKGNIYITGGSEETGFGSDAYCIVKYNSNGIQQWAARYLSIPHISDRPEAICVDKLGNVYVTGSSQRGSSYYTNDYLTVKYDSSGSFKWAKYYNGPANNSDFAHSIAVDDSCNVNITGESTTFPNTSGFCTIKYDTEGNIIWISRYDGTSALPNKGKKLVIDKFYNIYVTGTSSIGNTIKFCSIKYNLAGIQQWISYYESPTQESSEPFGLAIDSNLNIIITGRSFQGYSAEFVTIMYNNNGVQQWIQRYNGVGNSYDEPRDVCVDVLGNIYVTGRGDVNNQMNFITIKYNNYGIQQWLINRQGGGVSVAVDKNYSVYVAGGSLVGNKIKYTTIKYSQLIGINEVSKNISEKIILYQNYPNPFNNKTIIKFYIPEAGAFKWGHKELKLIIYNSIGQILDEYIYNDLNNIENTLTWDGDNYPSGIYFYRITIGNFTHTRKMLLLK